MASEFATKSTIENTRRTLVVVLLDVSGSMNAASEAIPGKTRIDELYDATQAFLSNHLRHTGIYQTGEIAIGAFNNRVQWLPLGPASSSQTGFHRMNAGLQIAKSLEASSTTDFKTAIESAYAQIEKRRVEMTKDGLSFQHKPQVYLVTDGHPTDADAIPALSKYVKEKSLTRSGKSLFYSFGVKGANFEVLRTLTPLSTYDLGTTALEEVLRLVSESIRNSVPVASSIPSASSQNVDIDPSYARVRQALPNYLYKGFEDDYAG